MPAHSPASQNPYETARLIRKHADRGLEHPSDALSSLREIRKLALKLDLDLDHEIRLAERRGTEPRKKPKQSKAIVGYTIEQGRYGIALSEHRSGGTAPFRCPKSMYDLIATVINDAPSSFKFNLVYDQVQERTGEEVPDYQARVAIRFLVHVGALKHSRARFVRDEKKSFKKMAKEAWDDLQRRANAGHAPA
jgi:hypothetical protein